MIKSFIIHLSNIPSSLESACQLQKDLKSIDIDAELFEGTYGHNAVEIFKKEKRTVHPISFKGQEIDDRLIAKAERPGVMGCFYSHYRLWKKCVELDETICIFEDDVKIVRPLIPVDFEDILVIVLGARKLKKNEKFLTNSTGEPRAETYFNSSMPGTPGYMITPKGAKKLLKCYKKTYLPSDNAINCGVVDIKIHSHIIGQANLEKQSLTTSTKFWNKFANE